MSLPSLTLDADFPLLPLRGGALFPGAVAQFEIGRPKTLALAEYVASTGAGFVLTFAQKDPTTEDPKTDDLHPIGTLARVIGVTKLEAGGYTLLLQGEARVTLKELTSSEPFFRATAQAVAVPEGHADAELDALGLSLRDATRDMLGHLPKLPRDIAARLVSMTDPGAFADFVGGYIEATSEEKASLLDTLDVKQRVRDVLKMVSRRTETFKVRDRINTQVKDEMGKTQREHILRQQLKAIKDELDGGEASGEGDLDELEKRVLAAELSEEAQVVARKQLKRLRTMQAGSPEYTMVRTYLDWILDLPWTERTDDATDIKAVRAVLDADHYGLDKVKQRIVEFLAVQKLKQESAPAGTRGNRSPILCLIGPPGVGKTSLGRSIAHALGRKFHRVSLGGVHDEAAIRGHRRTYIGALPGQIIQGMKRAATTNPVFMLDEVDKLGSDFRGDPSSALLEVLDPEQNNTFADHYLEIPYDLSSVMFVATANTADTIPGPLRDRMEIIEIAGYTRREKLAIAKRHLVPKQLTEHGIGATSLEISDEALELVISGYTREAGVRSLERQIAAIVRGVAVKIAEGESEPRVIRGADDLRTLIGQPRFASDVAERTEEPGVATGLAWTPVGGEILFIEAMQMPGKGKLTLTGQLGDVMKESAQAALSYVRSNAARFGIAKDFLDTSELHVHVPVGAMPKDGPSAGVTMLTALVSVLSGVRVRHDVAMTGEITLRGRVLPIGGVKEKVLAAHRAGIKRIILPERNRFDIDEVPDEVKRELDFVFVGRMDEVLDAALEQKLVALLPVVPTSVPSSRASAPPS